MSHEDRAGRARTMTSDVAHGSSWIKRLTPDDDAPFAILCFPPAGGGVMGYWPWVAPLRGEAAIYAVALPGREQRLRETPCASLAEIAVAVAAASEALFERPLLVFGHSFGALAAYETLRRIFADRRPDPARLRFVASGRPPPHRASRAPPLSHLEPREIAFRIAQLYKNIPPALLEEPDYVEMIGRALQADLRLNETYLWRESSPLPCAITAVAGTSDPAVSATELAEWSRHSDAGFDLRPVDGDHFYFSTVSGRQTLLDILRTCAASLSTSIDAEAQ